MKLWEGVWRNTPDKLRVKWMKTTLPLVVTDISLGTSEGQENVKSAAKFFQKNFTSFCEHNITEMLRCIGMIEIPEDREGREILRGYMRLPVPELLSRIWQRAPDRVRFDVFAEFTKMKVFLNGGILQRQLVAVLRVHMKVDKRHLAGLMTRYAEIVRREDMDEMEILENNADCKFVMHMLQVVARGRQRALNMATYF